MGAWFAKHIHDPADQLAAAAGEKARELAAAPEPKRGNPTGANQYGKPDRERKGVELPDASTQEESAKVNGIGTAGQKRLDKIAMLALKYLERDGATQAEIAALLADSVPPFTCASKSEWSRDRRAMS